MSAGESRHAFKANENASTKAFCEDCARVTTWRKHALDEVPHCIQCGGYRRLTKKQADTKRHAEQQTLFADAAKPQTK